MVHYREYGLYIIHLPMEGEGTVPMAPVAGVYIFILPIWSICWFGKKYDDLLRINVNIRGRGEKKQLKGEIFTVLWGKNNVLEKKGMWQK